MGRFSRWTGLGQWIGGVVTGYSVALSAATFLSITQATKLRGHNGSSGPENQVEDSEPDLPKMFRD